MRKLVARLFAAFVLMSVGLAPLAGQTTGSIRGVVETSHTALPGVTVEAKSPNLQGTRSAVTDAEGRFNLTSLPPGKYTVTARLEGFAPRAETVQLALTQAAVLNIDLTPAATAEVTVTSQAVPVETESNAIGRNLDAKAFQALPTGRNYADVTQLASGVNTDNSNVRQQSFTVYGSTGLENAYMVDGANTTGVEIGSQGKVLNFEFIQEVELKAGGYEAEYTGAQGGILNVVTKSGGNEYHGDVFGYFDNDGLQANNKHLCLEGTGTFPNCTIQETPDGIPVGFTKQDYGVDVGGFILKDSLWFFGAYDHVRNTLQRQITTGETAGTVADLDTTSNLYSAKADLELRAGPDAGRQRLRRSDRRQRRRRPALRAADDLRRHGVGGGHRLRRSLPGHPRPEVARDRPVLLPPGKRTTCCRAWEATSRPPGSMRRAGRRSPPEASWARKATVSSP